MKTLLQLCPWLLMSVVLYSCGGGTITSLTGIVEKQIVPNAPAPDKPSDGTMQLLPNGDLLYLNRQQYYPLVITRYDDTLGVRWTKDISLFHDEIEYVDWDALRIGTDSVCVFTTFLDEDGDDTAKYYARMISLADGGSRAPVHLFSYPLREKNLVMARMNVTNAPYGRDKEWDRVNAYHAPDKRTFLISTYIWPENGKTFPLTLSLFSENLTLIKKAVLDIPIEPVDDKGVIALGEKVVAALPTNSGDVIIATFKYKTRTLRFLRYAMLGDGKVTEVRHTFEELKDYRAYSFQFSDIQASSQLHVGAIAYDEPSGFITTGDAEFGAFYLGTFNVNTNALKVTKYAPSENQASMMFGRGLQNVGLKYMYTDEAARRIHLVFEEAREYVRPARYIGPDDVDQKVKDEAKRRESIESRTTYGADNILLASFDMDHKLQWERGIRKSMKGYHHMHLGTATSLRPNNTLSLWYPSDAALQFMDIDLRTGSTMSNPLLVKFFNVYFLPTFSVLDKNNKMYFVAQNGRTGSDSYMVKLSK